MIILEDDDTRNNWRVVMCEDKRIWVENRSASKLHTSGVRSEIYKINLMNKKREYVGLFKNEFLLFNMYVKNAAIYASASTDGNVYIVKVDTKSGDTRIVYSCKAQAVYIECICGEHMLINMSYRDQQEIYEKWQLLHIQSQRCRDVYINDEASIDAYVYMVNDDSPRIICDLHVTPSDKNTGVRLPDRIIEIPITHGTYNENPQVPLVGPMNNNMT